MKWKVTPEENALTAENWLQQRLPLAPPGYLGQLLRRGSITRNRQTLNRHTQLAAGDQIELPESKRLQQLLAEGSGPQIIRQTDRWLVACKPAGLAVHRSARHTDNLTDQVQELFARQRAPFSLAPVHRLDIGTSGPVLFGKGRQACGMLGRMIMDRGMQKQYLALVSGQPQSVGDITLELETDGKRQAAATSYRCLRRWADCSLLLVQTETGRKHQIRRHLAATGHPLAGDRRYRSPLGSPTGHPFLHQCSLSFTDPWTSQKVQINLPLPSDLREWLRQCGSEIATDAPE